MSEENNTEENKSDPLAPIYSSDEEPTVAAEKVETEPPKRRRGRPSNAEKLLEEKTVGASSSTKEKRTYKKKSDNAIPNVENLAKQIQGLHFIAAKMSGFAELIVDERESLMLAESIVNIAREYDLAMSGKTGAMIQLLGVSAIIYLPRFVAINERKKQGGLRVVNEQAA